MVFNQDTSQTVLIGCANQQLAPFIPLSLYFPRLVPTETTSISLPNFHSSPEHPIISLAQSSNALLSPVPLRTDPPQSVRCPGELPQLTHGVGCPLAPGAEDYLKQPWGDLGWGLCLQVGHSGTLACPGASGLLCVHGNETLIA